MPMTSLHGLTISYMKEILCKLSTKIHNSITVIIDLYKGKSRLSSAKSAVAVPFK